MKVERWEEETDKEWKERLAYETAIANNTETTNYVIERDPENETQFIIHYVEEDGLIWKEHPDGPFNAKQVLEWKKKTDNEHRVAMIVEEELRETGDKLDAVNNWFNDWIDPWLDKAGEEGFMLPKKRMVSLKEILEGEKG